MSLASISQNGTVTTLQVTLNSRSLPSISTTEVCIPAGTGQLQEGDMGRVWAVRARDSWLKKFLHNQQWNLHCLTSNLNSENRYSALKSKGTYFGASPGRVALCFSDRWPLSEHSAAKLRGSLPTGTVNDVTNLLSTHQPRVPTQTLSRLRDKQTSLYKCDPALSSNFSVWLRFQLNFILNNIWKWYLRSL